MGESVVAQVEEALANDEAIERGWGTKLERQYRDLLRALVVEVKRLEEEMSYVSGHDRQGLDHLDEAMRASEERDAAESRERQLRASVEELIPMAEYGWFGMWTQADCQAAIARARAALTQGLQE